MRKDGIVADENEVDTVTPLDGDGHNVTYPTPAGAGVIEDVAEGFDNVRAEDFETGGRTTVATPLGYAFAPSNTDVPVITHAGVKMTKEQAEEVVAESDSVNGRAYIVTANDDESEG